MQEEQLTARDAARRRKPLDGADAQALEGALQLTEQELALAVTFLADAKKILARLDTPEARQWLKMLEQPPPASYAALRVARLVREQKSTFGSDPSVPVAVHLCEDCRWVRKTCELPGTWFCTKMREPDALIARLASANTLAATHSEEPLCMAVRHFSDKQGTCWEAAPEQTSISWWNRLIRRE